MIKESLDSTKYSIINWKRFLKSIVNKKTNLVNKLDEDLIKQALHKAYLEWNVTVDLIPLDLRMGYFSEETYFNKEDTLSPDEWLAFHPLQKFRFKVEWWKITFETNSIKLNRSNMISVFHYLNEKIKNDLNLDISIWSHPVWINTFQFKWSEVTDENITTVIKYIESIWFPNFDSHILKLYDDYFELNK